MKINSEEILNDLISVFKINEYRLEGYRKIIKSAYSPKHLRYFQRKIDEGEMMIQELNPILHASMENERAADTYDDGRIDRSQFFFGIAKASDNPMTVIVSCQFGDELLVKIYQRILSFMEHKMYSSMALKSVLSRHILHIEETAEDIKGIILEKYMVGV